MISLCTAAVEKELGAVHYGSDVCFSKVSTDSRTVESNSLFVAIDGDRVDGHDYVSQAVEQGACALMVERKLDTEIPQLVVEDTRKSLGKLAAIWRRHSSAKVVGITGSNGKTTVKEMVAAILSEAGTVLATKGNFNNDIGLPLTLFRLQDEDFAVIEMGANHSGEIDYLTRITVPDVAILNNAGRAHLEGFGSLDGVARAKLEIIHGLADGGVFVYNADDRYAKFWLEAAGDLKSLSFGVEAKADVFFKKEDSFVIRENRKLYAQFEVVTPKGNVAIKLGLLGQHNQLNALAAIAASIALDIDLECISAGLIKLSPVKGRLESKQGKNGVLLLDDTYNANPESVKAAIDVLSAMPGRSVLILGDLAEMGKTATAMYAELGEYARAMGLNDLLTVGNQSMACSAAFGNAGKHFDDRISLVDYVEALLDEHTVVLVKGSRASAMEEVVCGLQVEEAA